MGAVELIALLAEGASAIKTAVDTYEQIKDTLSESDADHIHVALAEAEVQTERLRAQVDEALFQASKK